MAKKRKIIRNDVVDASATSEVIEVEKQAKALPAEKQARPVEVKPVDVTATIRKVPSIMAIRVLRGMLFYNDGYKMRREKLIPGKPVTVRITQQ